MLAVPAENRPATGPKAHVIPSWHKALHGGKAVPLETRAAPIERRRRACPCCCTPLPGAGNVGGLVPAGAADPMQRASATGCGPRCITTMRVCAQRWCSGCPCSEARCPDHGLPDRRTVQHNRRHGRPQGPPLHTPRRTRCWGRKVPSQSGCPRDGPRPWTAEKPCRWRQGRSQGRPYRAQAACVPALLRAVARGRNVVAGPVPARAANRIQRPSATGCGPRCITTMRVCAQRWCSGCPCSEARCPDHGLPDRRTIQHNRRHGRPQGPRQGAGGSG